MESSVELKNDYDLSRDVCLIHNMLWVSDLYITTGRISNLESPDIEKRAFGSMMSVSCDILEFLQRPRSEVFFGSDLYGAIKYNCQQAVCCLSTLRAMGPNERIMRRLEGGKAAEYMTQSALGLLLARDALVERYATSIDETRADVICAYLAGCLHYLPCMLIGGEIHDLVEPHIEQIHKYITEKTSSCVYTE